MNKKDLEMWRVSPAELFSISKHNKSRSSSSKKPFLVWMAGRLPAVSLLTFWKSLWPTAPLRDLTQEIKVKPHNDVIILQIAFYASKSSWRIEVTLCIVLNDSCTTNLTPLTEILYFNLLFINYNEHLSVLGIQDEFDHVDVTLVKI